MDPTQEQIQFVYQIVGRLYVEIEVLSQRIVKLEKERDDALRLLGKQEKV